MFFLSNSTSHVIARFCSWQIWRLSHSQTIDQHVCQHSLSRGKLCWSTTLIPFFSFSHLLACLLAALHSRKSEELLILLSKGFFSFFFRVSTFVLLLHSNSVGPKGSQNTASDLDSFLLLSPWWLFTRTTSRRKPPSLRQWSNCCLQFCRLSLLQILSFRICYVVRFKLRLGLMVFIMSRVNTKYIDVYMFCVSLSKCLWKSVLEESRLGFEAATGVKSVNSPASTFPPPKVTNGHGRSSSAACHSYAFSPIHPVHWNPKYRSQDQTGVATPNVTFKCEFAHNFAGVSFRDYYHYFLTTYHSSFVVRWWVLVHGGPIWGIFAII